MLYFKSQELHSAASFTSLRTDITHLAECSPSLRTARAIPGRSFTWQHGVRRHDGMGGVVMAVPGPSPLADWRVRGSYFEGCNCEAICPCRGVGGRPGGPSSFGECFGALSWHIQDGYADGIDLSGLRAVMSLRYFDRVQPSTPWEVVFYVDRDADDAQRAAMADIFLVRAGGTVAQLYGPAIGEVHVVRRPGSPLSTLSPASASRSSAISRSRPKAMPPSRVMSGAESRASTTQAPSCMAASCDRPTRRCAGRYEGGAMPPSPLTSTTAPTAEYPIGAQRSADDTLRGDHAGRGR